jgi:hypothetical protein
VEGHSLPLALSLCGEAAQELCDWQSRTVPVTHVVREEHLVAVPLLPAEQEREAEGNRWKVEKASVNVTQLNATASHSVDTRLHLIHRGPNAHLENGATGKRVTERGVEVGWLQLILVGTTWQGTHPLKATEAQQVILHALQLDALVAEEGNDRAQPGQLLGCRIDRP